jgi:hypothetical protein
MSARRTRLVLLIAAGAGVALLACASGAQASGILGSGVGPSIGPNLNPLPSVGELLNGVVNGLFGTLLSALTPSFLKHVDIHTLEWLVALPNAADTSVWPTVGRLEANMVWVAGALLPTTLIIGTARDSALSLTFRAHPGNALLRVIGAVFWLALYRVSFRYGVAFVNTLTHTMLSWPIVSGGLHRTVLVMFGGSVIFGAGGAFLALLGLVALVFAVCLFALKVLLLMVLAILFVSGPLFIALAPLPVIGDLTRGWLLAVVAVCLIPVGWCIIFATAGAISLDVTALGGGAHIGSRVLGAFAALVTFYIAFKWPLMVLGRVRNALGGLGVRVGTASSGGRGVSDGALAAKAQGARTRLQAAMLAGGRGLGLAAGQLGAPAGGLAGLAGRAARPHLAGAASAGAFTVGSPQPQPRAAGERIARAGEQLRQTPTRMREVWQSAGKSPAPGSSNGARPGAPHRTAGAPPTADARTEAPQRPGARGSATSTRQPSRRSGSAPVPGGGVQRTSHQSGQEGSTTSAREPTGPPPAPVARAGSSRGGDVPNTGAAKRQVSAPAQPHDGGGKRATQSPSPAASASSSRPADPAPSQVPPVRPADPDRQRPGPRSPRRTPPRKSGEA